MNVEVQWGWEHSTLIENSMNVKFNGGGALFPTVMPLLIFPKQEGCGRNGVFARLITQAGWWF
jgi:hypothetical protein